MDIQSKKGIIFFALASIGAFFSNGIIISTLPLIKNDFFANDSQVAMLISGYGISYVLTQSFFGYLSDKYGRKPLLIFSLTFEGIFMLFGTFAPSLFILILFRILSGVGGSALIPSAIGYIGEWTLFKVRGSSIGILQTIAIIETVISIPLGALIGEYYGWRYCFLFVGVLCLIGGIIYFIFLKEKKIEKEKIFFKEFLNAKLFILIAITISLAFSLTTVVILFPSYMQFLGKTPFISALYLLPTGIGIVIGAIYGGILLDKIGRTLPLIIGAGLFPFYFLIPFFVESYFLFLVLFALGFGSGFVLTSLLTIIADKNCLRGYSSGVIMTAMWIGFAVGTQTLSLAKDFYNNYNIIFFISGIVGIFGFGFSLVNKNKNSIKEKNAGDEI